MIALGMITTPRPGLDVHDSIDHLRRGGFVGPIHLFCEPTTPPLRPMDQVVVHRNPVQRGCVGNWALCLQWLIDHTSATHFLICEDDVRYCQGAATALNQAINQFPVFGFISLYTPKYNSQWMGDSLGWIKLDRARDIWGTQAMCFTRRSALQVLGCKRLRTDDQFRGSTDYIVMECVQGAGPCFYHRPSLADHIGKTSSIQHNWYDEHTGFEFDPAFTPVDHNPLHQSPARTESETDDCRRMAVISVYQDNIPQAIRAAQANVVARWLPVGCEFVQRLVSHHALGLDEVLSEYRRYEACLILDIDCIPLQEWAIPWFLENALAGTLVGCAQRANHLQNGNHIYAGPCALAFSREVFDRINRQSFGATERSDVGEEITRACEANNIPITLLWPTDVEQRKWNLTAEREFGLGTTYGDLFYHAFEISKGTTCDQFLRKAEEVLRSDPCGFSFGACHTLNSSPVLEGKMQAIAPVFHEDWYSRDEIAQLEAAVDAVQGLQGILVEIGCWEGRSTVAIANRCWPDPLHAVDHWEGNWTERPDHETVQALSHRDVFHAFQNNVQHLTRGNVTVHRAECIAFLQSLDAAIRFLHFDGAHDYKSVRAALELIVPRMVDGGIIVGHDFMTAHAGRVDLDGGVERAVLEILPDHDVYGNVWRYTHSSDS